MARPSGYIFESARFVFSSSFFQDYYHLAPGVSNWATRVGRSKAGRIFWGWEMLVSKRKPDGFRLDTRSYRDFRIDIMSIS
jgi:hypothetical protein